MKWEYLEIMEGRCGGRLTLKGTRLTVSRLLAILADGDNVDDFIDDYDYPKELVVGALKELSVILDNKENIYEEKDGRS